MYTNVLGLGSIHCPLQHWVLIASWHFLGVHLLSLWCLVYVDLSALPKKLDVAQRSSAGLTCAKSPQWPKTNTETKMSISHPVPERKTQKSAVLQRKPSQASVTNYIATLESDLAGTPSLGDLWQTVIWFLLSVSINFEQVLTTWGRQGWLNNQYPLPLLFLLTKEFTWILLDDRQAVVRQGGLDVSCKSRDQAEASRELVWQYIFNLNLPC